MEIMKEGKYLCGLTGKAELHNLKFDPKKVDDEEKEILKYQARFEPPLYRLPIHMAEIVDEVYKFEPNPNDVYVMTFPKSGTTWMQEIIWTIFYHRNLDHSQALAPLLFRTPWLEEDGLEFGKLVARLKEAHPAYLHAKKTCGDDDLGEHMFLTYAAHLPSPRVLKTHLAFPFHHKDILEKAKVVYVVRDPRSLLPSYHDYAKTLSFYNYQGDLDDLVQCIVEDRMPLCGYWNHVREAWRKRDNPNLHFVYFNELKKDMKGEIKKLCKFLGQDLTEQQIENVNFWCSFDEMKKRGSMGFDSYEAAGLYTTEDNFDKKLEGKFFRKGSGTDYKEALTPKHYKMIKEWSEKNSEGLEDFPFMKEILKDSA